MKLLLIVSVIVILNGHHGPLNEFHYAGAYSWSINNESNGKMLSWQYQREGSNFVLRAKTDPIFANGFNQGDSDD